MNKKLLLGSLLVLTLILLMPSIPAIQQRSIENNKLNCKDDFWDYPIINLLLLLTAIRILRGLVMMQFAGADLFYPDFTDIKHPLLFIRGWWLAYTGDAFCDFLFIIAKMVGWEW